jgi:putative transposase
MLEVTKCAPQAAIQDLGVAFKNFFAKRAKYPKFKKKGKSKDKFSLSNDQFYVEDAGVHIPRIGFIRMFEPLRFVGKITSAVISRTADRWFVSIAVEVPDKPPVKNQDVVGVDLGITKLATLSTGEKIAGPKPHKVLLGRLRRLSRAQSRKQKGSSNKRKATMKLARLQARIANIRRDALHKLTTILATSFGVIGIENLNVAGMVKNHHLARAISDMDCGSAAGEMPLSIRAWTCGNCGAAHDRDVNAAINLKNMAVSSTVSVCGEGSSGTSRKARVKLSSTKQKLGVEPVVRYA